VTATEHITEAEQCLAWAQDSETGSANEAWNLDAATVHATLAVARELADLRALLGGVRDEIRGLR
jgi:hypothetical protein